jgi:adenosylcobinamide-GDP ribazoletransferase
VRPRRHRLTRAARGLLGAVAFLTRVPIPPAAFGDHAFDLAPALPWFPLVGGAVGAVAGGVLVGVAPLVGRATAAVIALAVLVLVTGALHQDGLADTFDGLGVRGDRARRLAVMRDSTIGTFGVLALVVWALLLVSALGRLAPLDALRALIAAEALSRTAALGHRLGAPPARGDGLGATMPPTWRPVAAGGVVTAAVAAATVGPDRMALGVAVAAGAATVTTLVARRAVGGSTGDTLGATASVAEALVVVALAATWR